MKIHQLFQCFVIDFAVLEGGNQRHCQSCELLTFGGCHDVAPGLTNLMDPKQWPGQKKPGTHYSTQVKDTERAAFSLAFANSCPGVT